MYQDCMGSAVLLRLIFYGGGGALKKMPQKACKPFFRLFGLGPVLTLALVLAAAAALPAGEFAGQVVGVQDGDTLTVREEGGQALRIRLWGIDAPERGQAFSNVAKKHLSDLAFGKRVRVLARTQDRYGRTVAVIMLPDGRNVNEAMVKDGYAWWFRKYAPYDSTLEKLEREAKESGRGLWADPHAVPPWEFRHAGRPREGQ
jgi:endonuclease YncB( thermonuclease family)